eukprot:comp22457_c1_seq1/m.33768 comp22457_c1_seq1/g.33768  ORF comp22457_c1_seq1/g.33768 comp22457_c1_seq1/m.33768 type:complete len:167 (-) comp22457_c1_seq1:101-601(-)
MKSIIFAASLFVAGVAAQGTKVELYTSVDCSGPIPLEKDVFSDLKECVAIGEPKIPVAELGATYSYARLSPQVKNEILLFTDAAKCAEYPDYFDPKLQVTFIRASLPNTCTPCYRCGNVKSVRFTPDEAPAAQNAATQQPTSSANSFTPATFMTAFVVAAAATLFA